MLTYKDILFSVTKKLSDKFDIDVIVDNQEGIFENECFYVTIVPVSSIASTRTTDDKSLMISIKYFGGDKLKCYDLSDELSYLFARNIQVNNRFINISNTEPSIFNDEVGTVLDFLIYVNYNDGICINEETYELISSVNVNI